MQIEMASATDIGCVRQRNEDYILIQPDCRFAILADGLGGHRAGNVASKIASKFLAMYLRRCTAEGSMLSLADIRNAFLFANHTVRRASRRKPNRQGMGTTLLLAAFLNETLLYGYLGDSRLYRVRRHRLQQLTQDHTLAQEFLGSGTIRPDDERFAAYNAMLSRSIGSGRRIQPDIGSYALHHDDLYMLCSDGLSDYVPENEIANLLIPGKSRLASSARDLVDIALTKGGPDNISIVLVRVLKNGTGH